MAGPNDKAGFGSRYADWPHLSDMFLHSNSKNKLQQNNTGTLRCVLNLFKTGRAAFKVMM